MPEIDPVILQLRADVAKYQADVRNTTRLVESQLAGQERALLGLERRAEVTTRAIGSSFNTLRSAATGLFAGLGVVTLAREFLRLADASKQIDAQLRLATATFGNFGRAQEDVRRLSVDTRSSLEATSSLYGNFTRATKSLGGTQTEAARATETFSKALKLGGADAGTAASATLQFGQALASGVLRGDEFNSIAEASPRILQLLADALGKPRGELRALAEDGKLTSDVLFRALTDRRFTEGIDAEFSSLPVTFGEAMQQVENAALTTFGAFDAGGEFSTALANFVTSGATGFADLASAAEREGINIRATFEGLGDVFEPLLESARSAFGGIRLEANYTRDSIASVLGLYDTIQNADRGFDRFYARVSNSLFGTNFALPQNSNRRGQFLSSYDQNSQNRRSARAEERLNARAGGRTVNGRLTFFAQNPNARGTPEPRATSGGGAARRTGGAGRAGPSPEAAAAKAEREATRAREEQERIAARIESEQIGYLRELGQTTRNAAERVALQRQVIEAERKAGETELTNDQRLDAAQRARLIEINNLVSGLRMQQVQQDEDDRLRRQQLEIAQEALQAEDSELQLRSGLADTQAQRREIELRRLEIANSLERSNIAEDLAAATLAGDTARIAAARKRLADLETRSALQREQVGRETEGPGAAFRRSINLSAGQLNEAFEGIQVEGLNALNDGLAEAITGAKSLGDVFSSVADQIVSDLLRIAIQQAVIKPLANALFGGEGGGSGGGIGGLLGGLFGGSKGIVAGDGANGITGLLGSVFANGGLKLPGLAAGGTIAIGGRGGVDQNTLSINGRPVTRVSRGETLSVVNPGMRAMSGAGITVQQTINVDGRNSVTPAGFAQDILAQAKGYAMQAGEGAYRQSMRDAPSAVQRSRRYGTPTG